MGRTGINGSGRAGLSGGDVGADGTVARMAVLADGVAYPDSAGTGNESAEVRPWGGTKIAAVLALAILSVGRVVPTLPATAVLVEYVLAIFCIANCVVLTGT